MSVSVPFVSTLKTEFELLKYTFPAASSVSRRGCPIEIFTAEVGVRGGTPPAIVVSVYCCANAVKLFSNARQSMGLGKLFLKSEECIVIGRRALPGGGSRSKTAKK
jgi:hypothetical protein